jgi:hypothetical protein
LRFKDTIRTAKKAIKLANKNPMLYTDEEIHYMRLQLRAAKAGLKKKREMMSKGFKDESTKRISQSSVSDSRSGEDDGVRSEGEQPQQPGQS